ncbi:hypothetical protein A3C67_01015 [Candidatus Nomurabacteria bacterium RIFCSPHIGHO2_02_FULL_42_19]|uniref:Glycosidase n=1 Tax=Candidatus Nomurabacteria bacterium RIFCSPHIGHO2_02_FULL_42_19 TaxID=1801756 RepID=A0A1F6W0J8_9BACT|nr:MAG: hypothetical protein A3C67_01015 [Candidatus Nomurabacteria bacterium RIFCSPHIGHO2_02_FULL_42_19]
MNKNYLEHKNKAVETDNNFSHVMAITLDPRTYYQGIIRCITSREGSLGIKGYVDRSELHQITSNSLEHFTIGEKLNIKNEDEIIKELTKEGEDFIGLEDPDIWIDEATNLMHVYFTVPLKDKHTITHLGHAVGENLDSLHMTMPVLLAGENNRAKEVSIAPLNKKGFRYNLIESSDRRGDFRYSTVRVAIAEDMAGPWEYGETVFHPAEHNISWIGGHASPGPLFPETFINVGEGKRLGVINGREADQKIGGEIKYGTFSVGLFIYDYELGKIDWVMPEPFIQDSEAKIITFASQFVETGSGEGILYAHVDDSFVRAYTLEADKIKSLLPK